MMTKQDREDDPFADDFEIASEAVVDLINELGSSGVAGAAIANALIHNAVKFTLHSGLTPQETIAGLEHAIRRVREMPDSISQQHEAIQ